MSTCDKWKRCETCNEMLDTGHRKRHQCGKFMCKTCDMMVGHPRSCDIQVFLFCYSSIVNLLYFSQFHKTKRLESARKSSFFWFWNPSRHHRAHAAGACVEAHTKHVHRLPPLRRMSTQGFGCLLQLRSEPALFQVRQLFGQLWKMALLPRKPKHDCIGA